VSDAPVHDGVSLESLVAEVADEFLARQRRGERPAVEEYTARHPEHAAVIADVLAALRVVGLSGASGTLASEGPPAGGGPGPGELGDFRLVREVGRGGMGIVYEAVQLSLGRRVALKVLPLAGTLDPRQLQRFKTEAQAAAQLHHGNIVPVYAVGCERGTHYYAMQFIEGRTLADVIAELRGAAAGGPAAAPAADTLPAAGLLTERSARGPGFFRAAARLGVQAAEALEHAHQEGVVHRDVKPANLLVDAGGNLWVTDFGLARLQNGSGLTVSGDLVGTLRYMSPEQALGRPGGVDHRTDVYSLGATLYELVCLRPAFDGRDRQELLRQVAGEEPRPPRRVNAGVPAELEVIISKALEKEPAARYATARELADDLRRFLEDKPIRARRPTWLEQGRKWARRHRPAVWSAAGALLVALAALAGAAGWVVRDRATRQERFAAEVRAALGEAQRFQEEGKWAQGLAAARRAEALLVSGGGSAGLRESVREALADLRMVVRLEEVRILQSSLKDGHFDDEGADQAYAAAFWEYGIDVEALSVREAAERIRARAIRVELAAALDGWASTRRWYPRPGQKSHADLMALAYHADPDWRRMELRELVQRGESPALVQWAASDEVGALPPVTAACLAECLREMGALREATALLRRAQEQHPGDFWVNHQLGYYLSLSGDAHCDEAIRFYTAAVALRPDSPGAQLNLGNALGVRGRRDEARAAFQRALALRPDYAEAHCNLGRILWELGRQDKALAALHRAVELKPDLPEAHGNLGFVLRKLGRLDEAVAACRRSIELRRGGPEAAEAHFHLGDALAAKGQLDEAVAAFREAIKLGNRCPEVYFEMGLALQRNGQLGEAQHAYREAIFRRPACAEAYCNLANVVARLGRRGEAVVLYRRAAELKPTLALAHFNLGLTLTDMGRPDEALAPLHKAVELMPAAPEPHYDLGNALRDAGRLDEAAAEYRRAVELRPEYAEAHCNRGDALLRQGKFADAFAAFQRGHELGSRRRDWAYPSAQWVRECRRLYELDGREQAVLGGAAPPADAAECNDYARLCFYKGLYLASARLRVAAFRDPRLAADLEAGHRYHAACAAARASAGQGAGADGLADAERARWRRQALSWLRQDLTANGQFLKFGTPEERRRVGVRLRQWRCDPGLAPLRDPPAVARLPADEREACKRLWVDFEALLRAAEPSL
jgi:tetratricopeptide (TPR) repeat protein